MRLGRYAAPILVSALCAASAAQAAPFAGQFRSALVEGVAFVGADGATWKISVTALAPTVGTDTTGRSYQLTLERCTASCKESGRWKVAVPTGELDPGPPGNGASSVKLTTRFAGQPLIVTWSDLSPADTGLSVTGNNEQATVATIQIGVALMQIGSVRCALKASVQTLYGVATEPPWSAGTNTPRAYPKGFLTGGRTRPQCKR